MRVNYTSSVVKNLKSELITVSSGPDTEDEKCWFYHSLTHPNVCFRLPSLKLPWNQFVEFFPALDCFCGLFFSSNPHDSFSSTSWAPHRALQAEREECEWMKACCSPLFGRRFTSVAHFSSSSLTLSSQLNVELYSISSYHPKYLIRFNIL